MYLSPMTELSALAPSPSPWFNEATASTASIAAHRAQRVDSYPYRYEFFPQRSTRDLQPYEPASTPASLPPSSTHPWADSITTDIPTPGSQRHGARTDNANGFDGWGPAHTVESWECPTPAEMGWSFERRSPPNIHPTSPFSIPVPKVNYAPGLAPLDVLQKTKGIVDSVWAIAVAALQREADTRRQLEALLQAQAAPQGNRPTPARGTQVDSEQHRDEDAQARAEENTQEEEKMKSSVGDDETKVQFDVESLQGSDEETEVTEEDEARRFVDMIKTFEYLMKRFEEERVQEQAVLEDEKAKVEEEKAKVEQEKAKVEQEEENVEQEKAKVEQEKAKVEQEKAEVEQKKAEVEQKKAKVEQEKENVRAEKKRLAQMKQRIISRELASALKACGQLEKRLVQDKEAVEEVDTQFEAEGKMLDALLLQKMRDIGQHRPSGAPWMISQNVRTSANPSKEDIAEAEEMESKEQLKKAREEEKKADEARDPAEAAKNRAEAEWQSLCNRAQARRGKAGVETQETTTGAHAQGPN